MSLLSLLIIVITGYSVKSNTCKWDKLDLSSLSKYNLTCIYGRYELEYTPCKNHLGCSKDGSDDYMVIQYDTQQKTCVGHTADWDDGETLPLRTVNGTLGEWEYEFYYDNGLVGSGCENGRATTITWICDPDAIPLDWERLQDEGCGEHSQQNGVCQYWFEIYTYLACDDRPIDNNDNNGSIISVGSVLLIVFFISFIIYCIVGYMMNGFKTDEFKDWRSNIPHFEFWTHLPQLVKMGFIVTFECITGKNNQRMQQETQLLEKEVDDTL